MGLIDQIKAPIVNELNAFERLYVASTNSTIKLTKDVTNHILSSNGKQIRPLLTLLFAGMYGNISEKTLRAAVALELLHTATLTHDDVVDNSFMRRNKQTVNALWGNKVSILTGDYFLAVLLDLLSRNKDYDILEILAKTVRQITEGEFLQQQISNNFDYSENVYFEIIQKKTASLMTACCVSGTIAANASDEDVQKAYEIGALLGLIFQIKDDIFDYSVDSQSGKLPGNDIRELKFTLPLIYYIESLNTAEKEHFLEQFKENHTEDEFVRQLIDKVVDIGGVAYAENKMKELGTNAEHKLHEIPDSAYKTAVQATIKYIIDRNS